MFNKLLKLRTNNIVKTPLEDFTTELLVGVLNNDKDLSNRFYKRFLELKSNFFNINTQEKFKLENDKDCIVDIVIRGNNEICFIENKVNSREGYEQLKRYSKVLDKYEKSGWDTKLVYCTKRNEPKNYEEHDFFQYKWHELAFFLSQNKSNKITYLFLNYLKNNDMSKDLTIYSKDIIALENFGRILEIMNEYIDRVKPKFEELFGNIEDLRKGRKFETQAYIHNRFCILSQHVVKGEGWSEILFGFDFNGKIFSQIYIDLTNEYFSEFKKEIENNKTFKFEVYDNIGARAYLEKKLGELLNDENSEVIIEKWFLNSFKTISEFINKTKNTIKWS